MSRIFCILQYGFAYMKYQFPEGVIGTVFLCVVIIDIMVEIPGNTIDDETHGQH